MTVLVIQSPLMHSMYPNVPRIHVPIDELGRQMTRTLMEILNTGTAKAWTNTDYSRLLNPVCLSIYNGI